jgi:predicted  nucleic acid-binding Zn-ribbon protein
MTQQNNYKTPLKKLVQFFKESRDNWKAKYKKIKKENKRLEHKVRTLLKSRKKWKKEALELRKQIKQLNTKEEPVPLKPNKKNTNFLS